MLSFKRSSKCFLMFFGAVPMARPKKKQSGGRPTLFTPELGLEICMRMTDGESVRSICRDPKMPCRKTINNWLLKPEYEEFLRQYEVAETLRADTLFDEMFEIANDSTNDYVEKVTKNGDIVRVVNRANIQRARLKIDVMKWTLSKMLPKKYGDRIQQDHTVNTHISLIDAIIKRRKEKEEERENGAA
jgi:hypothetical protein